MPFARFLVLPLALGLAAFATRDAAAQTVINSVPYTISSSGKYILGTNLLTASSSQVAITISAPNVILDLNEFFVSGPGNTLGSITAVISVGNVSNVTIRNGTVANNGYGIAFGPGANSINHQIENIRFTRCYIAGLYFGGATAASLVRDNTFSQIGGSTFGGAQDAYAIFSRGGIRIQNNTITNVSSAGSGTTVSGIDAFNGDVIIGNSIVSVSGTGIRFGKCQNNLTVGCTTAFANITDAGGNF